MQPPYRDYLPDDDKPPLPDDWDQPPRPGHGTVHVLRDEDTGEWEAVWFDRRYTEISGTKGDVLAWARAQPAAEHVLFARTLGYDVPLESEEADAYLREEA
ncbi:hypothetical protein WDZ17_04270 [Pseudokineococcus basanitobsidens]|uniref:Uncharacterized protein n=1 Tax=Pseudokineococcus basanitobsidens TaxID=1926649 RepID=A0ABU8RHK8_9ACTN